MQISRSRYGKPPFKLLVRKKSPLELLVRRVQETPKTVEAVAIALGRLTGPEGKTLFLKIPHMSDTGLSGSDLELTGNLIPED